MTRMQLTPLSGRPALLLHRHSRWHCHNYFEHHCPYGLIRNDWKRTKHTSATTAEEKAATTPSISRAKRNAVFTSVVPTGMLCTKPLIWSRLVSKLFRATQWALSYVLKVADGNKLESERKALPCVFPSCNLSPSGMHNKLGQQRVQAMEKTLLPTGRGAHARPGHDWKAMEASCHDGGTAFLLVTRACGAAIKCFFHRTTTHPFVLEQKAEQDHCVKA